MTTERIIDPQAVLRDLKDFQRATATWVFQRMFAQENPATRFLVADEVGLGKTHVAKGVVAQVVDHLQSIGDQRHDIVYICSNGAIARQNLRKLVPKGIEPLDSVERLTMLPLADLNASNGVNLLAITPGTSLSFGSSAGRFEERALAYTFLREAWGAAPFQTTRARWVFWAGVKSETGDDRLKALRARQVRKIKGSVPAFVDELEAVDAARRHRHEPTLRETFDSLVEGLAWQRTFPDELWIERRDFIADVRRAMATVGIAMLEPDLVILDEFQRFKDLLEATDDTWASQLAQRLFTHRDSKTGRHTRNLLLSATPYRMYTLADETTDDHYTDFLSTCAFLLDDEEAVARLAVQFRDLRLSLTDPDGIGTAEQLCRSIETQLRQVMARTERLASTTDRSGMLVELEPTASVRRVDLEAYRLIGDVAQAVSHHEPSEYWKSSPYLLNFMEGYQLKRAFSAAVEDGGSPLRSLPSSGPGLLDWDAVDEYRSIDPQNARLRWLLDDLDQHGAFELLWLPPSLPYYSAGSRYETENARSFTKRLIFSGWTVVPKVISTLVSHEAERRAFAESGSARYSAEYRSRGGQRLDFRLDDGRVSSMTAFLTVWPSPTLARLGDPRPDEGEPPAIDELMSRVTSDLERSLAPHLRRRPTDGAVDQRWYWAAPLLLDQTEFPAVIDKWFGAEGAETNWTGGDIPGGFARHAGEAWDLLAGHSDPLGRVPADLVEVLARVAVGGPAVCALRAISSVVGLSIDDPAVLNAAARSAWGFRSFFNAPDVTALVERLHRGEKPAYWQMVAAHGVDGNLQAVLDEHAHVLRDWLGFVGLDTDVRRREAAADIGAKISEALSVRTSTNRVDVPRQNGKGLTLDEHRMRCRFAVPFGTQRAEAGGEERIEAVSAAFNSPFWPFVLTSTSVGQEGLDFHLWSHAVVHWNLPANPVDLEQREGRVHRYKGHAVRKNLASELGAAARRAPGADVWDTIFDLGTSPDTEMVPYWVYDKGPARIERHVPVLPFSRDAAHLPRLRKSLAAYRLAIGQPRQEELIEYLSEHLSEDELKELVERLRIDLTPPALTEG